VQIIADPLPQATPSPLEAIGIVGGGQLAWMLAQATTGSACSAFAARHSFSRRLRIIGYFTRLAL
jgi:hypothetical protein